MGHTILEICCCVGIMSVCMAIGAAHWGHSQRRLSSRAGALEIACALRTARAEAITQRVYCAVKLYDGTAFGAGTSFHGYTLYTTSDKQGKSIEKWLEGPRALPTRCRFLSGGNQTFVFGPTGNIVSRGINHKTVRVGSTDGLETSWHDITVLSATGRVLVKPMKTVNEPPG